MSSLNTRGFMLAIFCFAMFGWPFKADAQSAQQQATIPAANSQEETASNATPPVARTAKNTKQAEPQIAADIKEDNLGDTDNVFQVGKEIVLAGQPAEEDFSTLSRAGYKRILNLYRGGDTPLDEASICRRLGLDYRHLPFDDETELNDEIFHQVRIALLDSSNTPVFVHCKTNDRVAAVWAAYRTLDQGINLETAIKEAKAMGLKTDGYVAKLRTYVSKMTAMNSALAPAPIHVQPTIEVPLYQQMLPPISLPGST